MFFLKSAVYNAKRHTAKSAIAVLVCLFIVAFLLIYIGSLQANRRQRENIPGVMPIEAWMSNLNGSLSVGLLIPERYVVGFEESGHVKDLAYNVLLVAAIGKVSEEEEKTLTRFEEVVGINDYIAYPALSPENITFIDGESRAFILTDQAYCIADENFMEEKGLKLGDSVLFTLYYHTYPFDSFDLTYRRLGEYTLRIVGAYPTALDSGELLPPDIILPMKWLRKTFERADVLFNANMARFKVADPLSLNEFKAEMKAMNLLPVNAQTKHSHRGEALTVNDETFVRAMSSANDNIALMEAFLPFVFTAIIVLGYIVSYLLTNGRKQEIAVMRSLGVSRRGCFALLFLENAMLGLLGSALGVLGTAWTLRLNSIETGAITLLFLACYLLGTAAALYRMGRFSVMVALTALE